jgi:hypothetical protein
MRAPCGSLRSEEHKVAHIESNARYQILNVDRHVGPKRDNRDNDVRTVKALIHVVCLYPEWAALMGGQPFPDPTSTTMDRKACAAIRRYQDNIGGAFVASDGIVSPMRDYTGKYETGGPSVLGGKLIWTIAHMNEQAHEACRLLKNGADHVQFICDEWPIIKSGLTSLAA